MNKEKSELLEETKDGEKQEVHGIRPTNSVKYLGLHIHKDQKETLAFARGNVKKYLHMIKGRLRCLETGPKEELLGAYARSLLIYHATPLRAANIINDK